MNAGDFRKRDHRRDSRISKNQKLILTAEEKLESKLGDDLFTEGDKRLGWLLTFASSSWEDQETRKVYSCVDLYFVCQDGSTFKSKYKFRPYFYVATKDKVEMDVDAYLRRRYEGQIADIEIVDKEDLNLKNHLSGLRKTCLKISFDTVQQLMHVKSDLVHVVERNQATFDAAEAYESILTGKSKQRTQDFIDYITDLREYDVPYHVRFAIDKDVRCGQWYDVSVSSAGVMLERRTDLLQRAEVHVCAFDIETTKLPLKFPDAEYDLVMMISYMIDGRGFLIINKECVGEDIEDLEYTPKPEFEGCFKVINVKNEEELLRQWFTHMQELKPGIYVTYNGDLFDWPFLESRAAHHGFRMSDMMASYSVSDAVSTYYLYMTYVHPFIFSLGTIIPMPPDEVLRKGSGTLCEMLLMVQAYKANVICPNKHQSDPEKFFGNQLLESETYIGGHVECLESGVFISDLPTSFKLDPSAYEQLINNLDRDLQYAIRVEGKMDVELVSNYEEVKNAILEKLIRLRDEPLREECPLIYHLDVAAMYPNIILTNRLQVMQKVFALLFAEFRKLGAAIIFANFTKIIIDRKSDLSAAKAYSDSLLRALQTRDLFEWIELEPLQFWDSLLFMDQYNYGGIQARVHGRSSEDISKQNDEDVRDESQVEIVSSWNVAENLPKEMQDHFILVVSKFMYLPWKEQATKRESMRDGSLCTPSITAATAETFESQMAEYIRGQVTTYFTGKLLSIVRDANLHMKGNGKSETAQDSSNVNPQLEGNIFTGDPALEFIKHVCAVLALDQSVQHDILIMRKNLLKYVRVREFAPEAEFHNHSPSFTLPNVICSYCNDCRDLDLCRDRSLMAQEWRCAMPQCEQPYDHEVMENGLLQIVRQRERLYHLQDLVCLKCNQVKAAHLAENCACAGSFRCKEVVPEFQKKMQVFLKIAIQQKDEMVPSFLGPAHYAYCINFAILVYG